MKKLNEWVIFGIVLVITVVIIACAIKKESETIQTDTQKEGIDYLVLVNKENKLPDDWEATVQFETVKDIDGDECQVEKEALAKFYELRDELLKEDIDIELDSCYRSVTAQQELWDRWAEEKGIDYVKQYVAVPGYSEHHTGLALDICLVKDGVVIDDNDDMLAEKEIFAKIHEKLADYGFILRYLDGKDDITGYSYEPWHLRYVGSVEVAKEITDNGLTLEEYLAK